MKRHYSGFHMQPALLLFLLLVLSAFSNILLAQNAKQGKKISPDLFGLFFEDINYSADGGLYAEMVQNRSFEYNPTEQKEWTPYSFWDYITPGFSYGRISVESASPVHPNNPHYLVLTAEHIGHEEKYSGESGVGIKNSGFGGMVVKAGEKYKLALFARLLSTAPMNISISLQTRQGKILSQGKIQIDAKDWKNYSISLQANENSDSVNLVMLAESEGKLAFDVISLFPENTFKGHANGLRPDLAQVLADMHPRFIRFPGGCLTHGDGLGNMYRWKNTIGPIEQRIEQRNIWGYHQTGGLGYYEYFQFCEDIGAKALPVVPAGVSCQNSGGTWRIGGTGQRAIPPDEMKDYVQEVLDLIEWANGPASSTWGSKRAAAGHPAPFNLQYIGIGNEDKITPEFKERFTMIYDAVKAKYPNIVVIGTAGPFHSGEDFEKGWNLANQLAVPVIDEHYYTDPAWFMSNLSRYDSYKRDSSGVYLGEYASWGNKLKNSIAEAAYMTALERNGDIVRMASYAPLLAKHSFTQWKTDLIFFDNTSICLTPNYYVQKLFSTNQGDFYFDNVIAKHPGDTALAASCVKDSKTGDIVLKIVNYGAIAAAFQVDLSTFSDWMSSATKSMLTGSPDAENTLSAPANIKPETTSFQVSKRFSYEAPPMSLTIIRIKPRKYP